MKPIKEIIDAYPSQNRCGAEIGVHPVQLVRWCKTGALVDSEGHVWIRTTKKPLRVWPDDNLIDDKVTSGEYLT